MSASSKERSTDLPRKTRSVFFSKKRLLTLIGLGIFAYIVYTMDLGRFWGVIVSANPVYVLYVFVLSPVVMFLLAWRWKVLLDAIKVDFSFVDSTVCFSKAAMLGEFTPGKLGELYRAKYVMERGGGIGKGLLTAVVDRVYDVVFLALFGGFASLWLSYHYTVKLPLVTVLLGLVFLIFLMFLLLNQRIMKAIIKPAFNFMLPSAVQDDVAFHFDEFFKGLKDFSWGIHLKCFLITIACWVYKWSLLYLMALALGIDVPVFFMFAVGAMAVIVSLIPISMSGLGTREAVMIFFLSHYKISPEATVALSLLFVGFSFLSVIIASAISLAWQFAMRKLSKASC
jgi:uncharacterized protein (TIRG00374 family)